LRSYKKSTKRKKKFRFSKWIFLFLSQSRTFQRRLGALPARADRFIALFYRGSSVFSNLAVKIKKAWQFLFILSGEVTIEIGTKTFEGT